MNEVAVLFKAILNSLDSCIFQKKTESVDIIVYEVGDLRIFCMFKSSFYI